MDIVYAHLSRRQPATLVLPGEVAKVLGVLWAHATPGDGLEHAAGRSEHGRVDLILYLLATGTPNCLERVDALLARCHEASPLLNRRFWPPQPLAEAVKRSSM